MRIQVHNYEGLDKLSSDVVLVAVAQGEKIAPDGLGLEEALAAQAEAEKFTGKSGEIFVQHSGRSTSFKFAVVFGLGESDKMTFKSARKAFKEAFSKARKLKAETATLIMPQLPLQATELGQLVAEAGYDANYVLNHKKTEKGGHKKEVTTSHLHILGVRDFSQAVQFEHGIMVGSAIGQAVNLSRDLGNTPAAEMTPVEFLQAAQKVAAESNGRIAIRTLNKKTLTEMGAGGILAVCQASQTEPVLIELTYTPLRGATEQVLGLVGKTVTFDTGGLNIKTGGNMGDMKFDMCGGADVISAIKAIADIGVPISVKAYCAAVENSVDSRSYRPGDVLYMLNGKTVENRNSDAEGRLALADACEYAQRQGVTWLVDVATLTGAALTITGAAAACLCGNKTEFSQKVLAASASVGENLQELVMFDEIREYNKTDMADVANTSGSNGAGTTGAAWFIREFIREETPWVHLDIAGVAWASSKATGFGVRTLVKLAQNLSEGR